MGDPAEDPKRIVRDITFLSAGTYVPTNSLSCSFFKEFDSFTLDDWYDFVNPLDEVYRKMQPQMEERSERFPEWIQYDESPENVEK